MEDEYSELRASFKNLITSNKDVSYKTLADQLGVSKGALHKFCNDPTYVPRSGDLREAFGIGSRGEIIVQVAVRAEDGTFARR